MTFEQRLQATLITIGPAKRHPGFGRDRAAALVATHAPHLLKRFAALAGSLQTLPPTSGQGVILACRNGPLGYRTVEYRSHNLSLVLDATDREACLSWDANGEIGMLIVTPDTTIDDLDNAILNAVAAFVRSQTDAKAAS